ncbi:MAG: 3-oxoacyl-ACP synthase [candidate division Zixibacteria bacterium RBG_16_43_9]|nr:MAG: 3-oxoacyl-ACP synthase [candidate division Zixibacteria bacterium RBG_16_43_9]
MSDFESTEHNNRFGAVITGTGSFTPEKVLTNADLEKMVETTDEWITARSGIKERRIADKETAASDLSFEATKKAMEEAKIKPEELDLILIGTVTPDYLLPSTACILQDKLGAKNAAVMDIVAACSGFLYGLSVAQAFIYSGKYKTILVIGVEVLSKITNWNDRNTCVLFGDGAGAAIVQRTQENNKGILATYLCGDGSLANLLHIPVGGTRTPLTKENIDKGDQYIKMEGNEVFKSAVRSMGDAATRALKEANISAEQIDLLIPHQANIRIIEATAKRLKLPMEKVFVNIDKYGNTSAASIPIALDEARKSGRIKPGDITLLVAFGAGFTWGSAVIRW